MIASGLPELDITPRDIHFGLDRTRISDWAGGSFARTAFFNALSILFPQGERLFITSVAAYRDRIADPKLLAEVKAFSMQEGLHTREHLAYNAALQDVVDVEKLDRESAEKIAFLKKNFPPITHLAITCALEHFTAIMAHESMQNPDYFEGADPTFARLWQWHALEECEHKSVAFDVFRTVTKGEAEFLRRREMFVITINFLRDIFNNVYHIYKAAGKAGSVREWAALAHVLFVNPGFMRKIVRPYLKYYKKDFHPSQIDDSVERERARATIAAAYGV
jgi:predicted metal-dependent hydrolase